MSEQGYDGIEGVCLVGTWKYISNRERQTDCKDLKQEYVLDKLREQGGASVAAAQ